MVQRVLSSGEQNQFAGVSGKLQYQIPAATVNAPATIATSGTFTTALLQGGGLDHICVGGTLSQAGTLETQLYLDSAGTIAQGTASTTTMSAGTAALLDVNTGKIFQSYKVSVVNAGTAAATLTNLTIVQEST